MISEKKITTVKEYFAALKQEARTDLEKLRHLIRENAPEAEELISYEMPAFKFYGILVYYAAFKNHYSLFPKSKAIEVFREELKGYQSTKGTIHFPFGKPLDEELIAKIIRFRVKENLEKTAAKQTVKKIKSLKQKANVQ
jgi:uncharacterized protein YdhG (YjbR/CyaY superfamily)